ncbi:MAG TPA: IucA/IucC family protein [Limnobacter sp.]|nr:IucA/IucC family protein [Limnobacter sp.]
MSHNIEEQITLRLINACLREDVRNLVSNGKIQEQQGCAWLLVSHLATPIRLLVTQARYLQPWQCVAPQWQILKQGTWIDQSGAHNWLNNLAEGLPEEDHALFVQYAKEVDVAIEHGALCRQARLRHAPQFTQQGWPRCWPQRLLHADQAASYLDHPYYPTARAKFGLDAEELQRYCPEFSPQFQLNWIALPRDGLRLNGAAPGWWPTMQTLDLPKHLEHSHIALPVHPTMYCQLLERLPQAIAAPRAHLAVQPTLSVRTVAVVNHPAHHIKLPMPMATLGQKNLRMIKPSTLQDGHWFAHNLRLIEQNDPALGGTYRHCDESFSACYQTRNDTAFLVRQYPELEATETLATVASLCSPMPNGRPYIATWLELHHLDLSEWWTSYCKSLIHVHLRLWVQYGIALEANQQNSVLSLRAEHPVSLVMKDNDAARLWPARFGRNAPPCALPTTLIEDERICVADETPLAHMFITIILQLNMLAVLDGLDRCGALSWDAGLQAIHRQIRSTLDELRQEGHDTTLARELLLYDRQHPVKYLLQSASLMSKSKSGATDVNKFYGLTGPNPLRDLS